MMGYNGIANQDLTLGDTFKGGRKPRPLVPRPPYLSSPPNNHNVNTTCLTGFHNPTSHHLFSLNNNTATLNQHHHFVGSEEGNKEAVGTHQVMVSLRWNPTPEQLRALEELYRRGTRTPSAEQIQHITAQLRRYGKIEGKNVFYWFQNHKARERQKRRRQLQLPLPPSSESSTRGNRIGFEVEQKSSKWVPSTINKEDSDPPIQIAEEAGLSKATERTSATTSLPLFSLSSKLNSSSIVTTCKDLNKKVNNNGNNDLGESPLSSSSSSSPTLRLFPVVRDDDDVENDSCLTNDEKASNMPKLCNNNNPFPYYQFL